MKRHYLYLSMAALLIAGCAKENNRPAVNADVNIVLGSIQTRSITNTDTYSTNFAENDQIGIFSTGLKADMANALYTVAADGTTVSSETEYQFGESAASFHAYFPYNAELTSLSAITFSTPADQSTETAFNSADFMTATATQDPNTGSTVVLNFEHQLSFVKVVWSDTENPATSVAVNGILPDVTWNGSALGAASGTAVDIQMWEAKTGEFWALVPAQTISAGKPLFTITTADKSYEFKPANDVTFSANQIKTYTLKVNASETVVAVSVQIGTNPWGNNENFNGDVDEVVVPPIELISAQQGTFSAETELAPATGLTGCKIGGWSALVVNNNGTVAYNSEVDAIAITATGGSWYQRDLVWRSAEGIAKPAKYQLKFKVKNNSASADITGDDIQIAVMAGDLSTNVFFILNDATSGASAYSAAGPEWADKKYTVNLTGESAANLNTVRVVFTPKTIDTYTYYIKDVSLIEIK